MFYGIIHARQLNKRILVFLKIFCFIFDFVEMCMCNECGRMQNESDRKKWIERLIDCYEISTWIYADFVSIDIAWPIYIVYWFSDSNKDMIWITHSKLILVKNSESKNNYWKLRRQILRIYLLFVIFKFVYFLIQMTHFCISSNLLHLIFVEYLQTQT